MPESQPNLRRLVQLSLLRIILVQLSIMGILALVVKYDLDNQTPWILQPTITRVLGWMAALYGLFWITWWFFWVAIEGGEQEIDVYNVRWAPVTSGFATGGPFEWLRYPLVFGYLEFLWGLGFLMQSSTAVVKLVPALAVAAAAFLLIVVEPRRARRYGDSYRRYRKSTPLIIPRIPNRAAMMTLFRRRRRR